MSFSRFYVCSSLSAQCYNSTAGGDRLRDAVFCFPGSQGILQGNNAKAGSKPLAGKELTLEDCAYGWQGYAVDLPQRNLDKLIELRQRGFRLSLLSNTNPFMMQWVRSSAFDGRGHGLDHYFDALYLSYEMGIMKPARRIFEMMLQGEKAKPLETVFIDDSPHNTAVAASMGIHVLQPDNGADWHGMLEDLISRCNSQD